MGDTKFTLIELHLDGSQFGLGSLERSLPFSTGETTEETADADEEDAAAADDESGGRSAVGAVVALVALVGIALAVRKFRGGDEEEPFEEEERPDVVVN